MNRRDQQIASINASVEGLREDRLAACRAQILSAYVAASVIDRLAHVTELTDREPSDFRVLTNSEARHIDHFNDDSYHWDLYCEHLGRSIALGEMRYLFERTAELPPSSLTISADNPDFGLILDAVGDLSSRGYKPNVLFAPGSMFVPFNTGKELRIDWEARPQEALVAPGGELIEVFWSSGIASLSKFVLFDSRAGLWNVKLDPHTSHRLTVAIGRPELPPEAVTFLAETVVRYEIEDPKGFLVLEVEGLPPGHLDQSQESGALQEE